MDRGWLGLLSDREEGEQIWDLEITTSEPR